MHRSCFNFHDWETDEGNMFGPSVNEMMPTIGETCMDEDGFFADCTKDHSKVSGFGWDGKAERLMAAVDPLLLHPLPAVDLLPNPKAKAPPRFLRSHFCLNLFLCQPNSHPNFKLSPDFTVLILLVVEMMHSRLRDDFDEFCEVKR